MFVTVLSRPGLCANNACRHQLRWSSTGFSLNRSAGMIFDPYKYVPPEEVPSSFSAEGVQHNLAVAKSVAKSSYSAAFITRHIPTFAARTFPAEADSIFTAFMDGHREGNLAALRSVVTEGLLEGLWQELKAAGAKGAGPRGQRKGVGKSTGAKKKQQKPKQQQAGAAGGDEGKFRSAFVVDGFVRKSEVLQMRHGFAGLGGGGGGNQRSAGNGFGQVTVMVQSRRQVVVVDLHGQRVGDDATLVEVPSLCVFESSLAEPRGHWRLARIEEIGQQKEQ
jgi:hypothetical protein